jgi:hypothetical protein
VPQRDRPHLIRFLVGTSGLQHLSYLETNDNTGGNLKLLNTIWIAKITSLETLGILFKDALVPLSPLSLYLGALCDCFFPRLHRLTTVIVSAVMDPNAVEPFLRYLRSQRHYVDVSCHSTQRIEVTR